MEGFRVEDFLKEYVDDVCAAFPEFESVLRAEYAGDLDPEREVKHFESVLRPLLVDILQKNDSIFQGEESRFFLRGVDFRQLWSAEGVSEETKDTLWKYIRLSLASCVLGGSSSESMMETIMSAVKSFLSKKTGKSEDELETIFEEEQTQGALQELIDSFMQTKLAKIATELIETFDFSKLGLEELGSASPTELMEIIKNPEHPLMKRAIRMIQQAVEEKMREGALTKEELLAEVEGLKEKIKLSMGKFMQEAILGETRRDATDHRILMSNHPDARRARMLARLQRKVKEKQ
jgi:hypothetical protein